MPLPVYRFGFWLGWQDLNLRMRESKSRALPLGDTPTPAYSLFLWGGRQVSNLLPPEPQSGALPIELRPPFVLVRLERFEPPTHGLEGRCSILLSYRRMSLPCLKVLERVMGIGPTQPAWKASVLPLNYTRILHEISNNSMLKKLYQIKFMLSTHFLSISNIL